MARKSKAQAKNDKFILAHKIMNIITGILALVITIGLSAAVLFQTFTWLLNWLRTSGPGGYSFKTIYIVLICGGITLYCVLAVIFGIITAYHAHSSITYDMSTAFGVFDIIFAFLLPGILYLITKYLHGCIEHEDRAATYDDSDYEDEEDEDNGRYVQEEPDEDEEPEQEEEERDPRTYFTEDEDDVGEVPDINPVDFGPIKKFVDHEMEDDE